MCGRELTGSASLYKRELSVLNLPLGQSEVHREEEEEEVYRQVAGSSNGRYCYYELLH